MKKLILILTTLILFTACGNENNLSDKEGEEVNTSAATVAFEDAVEAGEGEVFLVNASGETKDGNVITVDSGLTSTQTAVKWTGMDGGQYDIYVDGSVVDTLTMGDRGQNSINLEGDALSDGSHKVEIVSAENGADAFYRLFEYEVK